MATTDTVMTKFDAVPLDEYRDPLLVASTEAHYRRYIAWLADYLYRPTLEAEPPLPYDAAASAILAIESEVAFFIWDHPAEDYPPEALIPATGARHADILHREALCAILSRVPRLSDRTALLDRFYKVLWYDARK